MDTTLEVLVAARAEVEKGWGQGAAVDMHGNVCALSAIDVACGADRTPSWARFGGLPGVADAIAALYGVFNASGIPTWNDAPSTTKADVLALYDRAIAAEAVKASSDPSHVYTLA